MNGVPLPSPAQCHTDIESTSSCAPSVVTTVLGLATLGAFAGAAAEAGAAKAGAVVVSAIADATAIANVRMRRKTGLR
ncbi:MAG TPA: hypothetical protein VHF06_00795 [Pseudonocardiaceae bacterium]|nr:hypothetical protein [Pseudonocardiaceae bacterium]